MVRIRKTAIAAGASLLGFALGPSHAGVTAADGGITLWVSWDNLDTVGATLADAITEANSLPGGFSCEPTTTGRTAVGASAATGSCPASGTCTGQDKLTGDLEDLADYIWEASEGTHYLRRVYIADEGRSWDTADIRWNVGIGGSSAPGGGWADPSRIMSMNSAYRTCIADVAHHELGHYFYNLPDRYARSGGYYRGTIGGSAPFDVDVTGRDVNTVMSNNFPHRFVDTTNARIVVDYDPPSDPAVTGEVLTPDLLTDSDPDNDGPNRAHHGHTMPFAQDEWSILPTRHVDLEDVHTEGDFPAPSGSRPALDIVFIGDDEPHPGTVLLLDRSGSMGVTTNGVPAAQFVQEAGMYLYHSSEDDDFVGTSLYNASVEELFPYAEYDAGNELPFANFRTASGATDIAAALKSGIDALIAQHGEGGANGGKIYLMSDGRQTTGDSLWDQVSRANERGIQIHTFSFGDADTATMESIATGTSGSTTPLSERDDASELKLVMTRKISTGRGRTPVYVYKGELKPQRQPVSPRDDVIIEVVTGTFEVPPKSRDIQFYLFFDQMDASGVRIELTSPSGAVTTSSSANNVAQKGRFNGVTVKGPEAGTWRYRLLPTDRSSNMWPPTDRAEIVAYTENRELSSSFWLDDQTSPDTVDMRAQLTFRYPLSDIGVRGILFAGGEPKGSVSFADDGQTGGDVQPGDGIYSAQMSLAEWRGFLATADGQSDALRVEVEFDVSETSGPAPFAHYETGFTGDMADADYRRGNEASFRAYATGVLKERAFDPKSERGPRIEDGGYDDNPDDGGWRQFGFIIRDGRPLEDQLRVSVGGGMDVEIEDVRDCTGADEEGLCTEVTGRFRPKPGSSGGPGGLTAQFGDTVLTFPGFAPDAGGPGGPGHPPHGGDHPPHGKKPHMHDQYCVTFCASNPYLLWGIIGFLSLISILLLIAVIRLSTRR